MDPEFWTPVSNWATPDGLGRAFVALCFMLGCAGGLDLLEWSRIK